MLLSGNIIGDRPKLLFYLIISK